MSYLQLNANPMSDNAKGIISFWFRFSQDAIDAVTAYDASYQKPYPHPEAPDILRSTIPFITFGRNIEANVWDSMSVNVATPPPFEAYVAWPVFIGLAPDEPSHIGLTSNGTIKMVFKMDSQEYAEGYVTRLDKRVYSIDASSGGYVADDYVSDISYIRIGPGATFSIESVFTLDPDRWHHMLLSYDFSAGCAVAALPNYMGEQIVGDSTSAYAKIWYAVDDVNRNGANDMGQYWVEKDDNGIISETALTAAVSFNPAPPPPTIHGNIPAPAYRWSGSVPLNGGHVGIPAGVQYVETVYHCEMAELQFFSGVTIDTGSTSNRRAFVTSDGKPEKPEAAEKLLGKRPEILLHGNSNWQQGKNTGSIGVSLETGTDGDEREVILPSGQFSPTGVIKKYKPEPKL